MTTRVSYKVHRNVSFCTVSTKNKPSITYVKAFVHKPFHFIGDCVADYIKKVCYKVVE